MFAQLMSVQCKCLENSLCCNKCAYKVPWKHRGEKALVTDRSQGRFGEGKMKS